MRFRANSTPSFRDLKPASPASSHAKQMNRSVGAKHEKLLSALLWRQGLRYRKNVATLVGKPDIVFPRARLVVFCDGDFWHGYRLPTWEHKLNDFWKQKIRANRKRDQKNFLKLRRMGWRVIRIWQHEIRENPARCTERIALLVTNARQSRCRD